MAKSILITGATRGIGFALAAAAAARGDRVIATARRPETAERLATLASLTGRIEVETLDVVDETVLATLADKLSGRPLDLVVANAGYLPSYGGMDAPGNDAEQWRETLMVNVFGPFATVRAFRPHLTASRGKAAILASIMGSTAAALEKGTAHAYRASKAAAVNLARNLAAELKPDGVAVGAYHPGWVRTDMGGPEADISVEESAEGLLQRFDALSMESTGVFEDYQGAPIAF